MTLVVVTLATLASGPRPAAAEGVVGEGPGPYPDSLAILLDAPFPDIQSAGTAPEDTSSVSYEAEYISYDLAGGHITLLGTQTRAARVQSAGRELSAGKIVYSVEDRVVHAEGITDTAGSVVHSPVYLDHPGDSPAEGESMTYSLSSGKGSVTRGKTSFGKGFYRGAQIEKVSPKRFEIKEGIFTTCDRKHPHYDFVTRRLTVVEGDKVVGHSAVLRIWKLPVFYLPYYVFPVRRTRHSGVLTPQWGSNALDGWNLANIGYYYAPNDYYDGTITANIRQRTGWLASTDIRYAARYRFNGNATFSVEQSGLDGSAGRNKWRIGLNHTQSMTGDFTLRASGDFVSDKDFLRQNSNQLYDRMNRTLRSYLSGEKVWRESGKSLDVRILHEVDLDRSRTTLTFPRAAFRSSRSPISGRSSRTPDSGRWYNSIYYSYSANMGNVITQEGGQSRDDISADGRFNVSSQHKPYRWLNLTPSLDLSESWARLMGGYSRRESYSAALSSSSTFYGVFSPPMGPVKALRHVVKPSVSVSSSVSVAERDGRSGFADFGSVGSPSGSVALRLGNILQAKTVQNGKERKADIASFDLSSNYRIGGEGRHWSDISSTFAVKPDRRFDVRLVGSHTVYDKDGRLLPLPHLARISSVTTLSLSGDLQVADTTVSDQAPRGLGYLAGGSISGDRTWRISITHNYSLVRGVIDGTDSWLRGSVALTPLGGWRAAYDFNLNLDRSRGEPRITSQTMSFYRDLHDWDADFSWTPSGYRKGYYFRIAFKEFPQIKFERKGGTSRF